MGGCLGKHGAALEQISSKQTSKEASDEQEVDVKSEEVLEKKSGPKEAQSEAEPESEKEESTGIKIEEKPIMITGKFIFPKEMDHPDHVDYNSLVVATEDQVGWNMNPETKEYAYIFDAQREICMEVIKKMIRYPKLNRLVRNCSGAVYRSTRSGLPVVVFVIKSPKNIPTDIDCAVKTLIQYDHPALQDKSIYETDLFSKRIFREDAPRVSLLAPTKEPQSNSAKQIVHTNPNINEKTCQVAGR